MSYLPVKRTSTLCRRTVVTPLVLKVSSDLQTNDHLGLLDLDLDGDLDLDLLL